MNNAVILFLISPFLGLIQGFKYFRQDWAKNSIWLFVVFYGFTMFRPEIMDANRYVMRLHVLYEMPLSWDTFIANFYSDEGTTVDLYQPLVTYFLALFTKSANVLFAIFGIVYGYFYSRNIWLLLDIAKHKKTSMIFWGLILAFAAMIGFWELNGVRMWTAAHMFFYGAFLFLIHGNKKGLVYAGLSVLVHFSFVLPFAILIAYTLVKVPWKILYFAFIGSFFISELNITSVGNFLTDIAPSFLVPRINSYTSDEYIETVSDVAAVTSWYVTFYLKAIGWFIFVGISFIYFSNLARAKSNQAFSNFFGFTILFLTVGNFMSLIPSGGRFLTIGQLFALALLFLYFVWYETRAYRKYIMICSPMLVFFLVVSIRMSFETTTYITVLGNPIIAMLVDLPIPLITLFK